MQVSEAPLGVDARTVPCVNAPAWGAQSLTLQFAGVRFVLHGLSEAQQRALAGRYLRAPATAQTEPAVETHIHRLTALPQNPDDYTTAGFYTPRVIRRADDRLAIEGHGFLADVSLRPQLTGKLFAADGDLLTAPLVIENYLRIIAAYASLAKGGLLIHSAGVVAGGGAYLFLGPSGAGKTTMSRLALACGAGVLSDDINIALPAPGGDFSAGAVPFAGELGTSCLVQAGDYPLCGVFWLHKGAGPLSRAPTPFAAQLARLYACCPVINADARQMDDAFAVARRLLTAQPLRDLYFTPDETFSAILQRIGNQHG